MRSEGLEVFDIPLYVGCWQRAERTSLTGFPERAGQPVRASERDLLPSLSLSLSLSVMC